MALSQSVKESLEEAEAALRNALSYAARQERPMICASISEIMCRIESMKATDDFLDLIEKHKNGGDGGNFKKFII